MVENPAEVWQTTHKLLVVHKLHEIVGGGLRLLLRFHFPHHIQTEDPKQPRPRKINTKRTITMR